MANFTNNQVSWIHSRAFRYMKSLTELSFSGNRIKDSVTVGRAVQAVKGLRSLDVSHNQVYGHQDFFFYCVSLFLDILKKISRPSDLGSPIR